MSIESHISVVIVTYQSENEITACLQSLLENLKGHTYQIFVVDNNSSDGTRQHLENFQNNESIQIILNKKNLGFTRALNLGLRESRADVILVLNPDIVLHPGCLDILIKTLDERREVGVVAPQLLNADGSVQPSCRRFPKHRDVLFNLLGLSYVFKESRVFNGWKMADFDHHSRRLVEQPQGAFLFFKSIVLEKTGLWDESFPMFFSDVDWCKRVQEHGFEILFEPAAKAVHHQGRSVFKARSRMIWSSHVSFYKYFRKYKKKFSFINEVFAVILIISAVIRIVITLLLGGVAKEKS